MIRIPRGIQSPQKYLRGGNKACNRIYMYFLEVMQDKTYQISKGYANKTLADVFRYKEYILRDCCDEERAT